MSTTARSSNRSSTAARWLPDRHDRFRNASKKVTLTVDRYANNSAASAAYRGAVAKSKLPGFAPIAVPAIGQSTFGGTVTQGSETHVGIGAVDGNLIIGATLAGYPATAGNVRKLGSLARAQDAAAKFRFATVQDRPQHVVVPLAPGPAKAM